MTEITQGKPRVVVSCRAFEQTLDLLGERCEVIANQTDDALSPGELRARCRDADALLAFMPDTVDEAFLSDCPGLRVIGCALKGYDNFDIEACTRHGVWITAVPDLLTAPTAELAVGLMIGIGRHIMAGDAAIRSGNFAGWRPVLYGAGLAGATVGIVGMGKVGRAIAARLAGFEATILYHDTQSLPPEAERDLSVELRPLPELTANSDFLVIATPLTPDTRHLIDTHIISAMKPSAYLINPARGSVVDEAAVAAAVAERRLAGYAADAFALEDWALDDRPDHVHQDLLDDPAHTLFTPHIGSAVTGVRREIERDAAVNILEALSGERPHGAINSPVEGANSR